MKKLSRIGSLSKKIYRIYSNDLNTKLQSNGFLDLRPSFLEILMYICENHAVSIKEIGLACGLKKQTMTSHLNELEKRDYIVRKVSDKDRREFVVSLTEFGEMFKFTLLAASSELEEEYLKNISEVEMDRIAIMLDQLYIKIQSRQDEQIRLL